MHAKTLILLFSMLVSIPTMLLGFSGEAENAKDWSIKMANSVLSRNGNGYQSWDYTSGTMLYAINAMWLSTQEKKYYDFLKKSVDNTITSSGSIKRGFVKSEYNIDKINEGRIALRLYQQTGESKYKNVIETLYDQLLGQPRTSRGGFWHKQKYTQQMWLDGLYMGCPFYTEYSKAFNLPNNYDDIVLQIAEMEIHMRDEATGLLYHGWQSIKDVKEIIYWADPVTGCSKNFWGRGMGWYIMGIVDVLDSLPKTYELRDSIIHIFQRLSSALVRHQDPKSGCWYQVVNLPTRSPNYLESSGSCMFVYGLAKGLRLGYLDNSYYQAVEKGYNGLIKTFVTESSGRVNLSKTCSGAGLGDYLGKRRDGTFDYYMSERIVSNDKKAMGPFILAGLELSQIRSVPMKKPTLHNSIPGNYRICTTRTGITIHYPKPMHDHDILQYKAFTLSGALLYSEQLPVSTNSSSSYTMEKTSALQGATLHCVYKNGTLLHSSKTIVQ